MIVSWNWLAEYITLDMPVDVLTSRLTMAGLNLESTESLGDDVAIDLEVTSNRPDCLGHLGVAREVGVLFDRAMTSPNPDYQEAPRATSSETSVEIECPDLCPAYIARVVEGVRVGPSPAWMQKRLEAIGVTPVNNIVDVTNYVMFECGQPLHAFDLDKLAGRRIIVRRGRADETIAAIDHRDYAINTETCVIADERRPVAIAGVMGGADTEINDQTTNLLIEVACFQPLSVHHTARRLRLHSPSSYRFERRVDDRQLDWAGRRCCQLILETAGGTALAGNAAAGDIGPWEPEPITLRFSQLARILGIQIPAERATQILVSLGLEHNGSNEESASFRPPSWRRDLTREIDLIEEAARIHGYDAIPEDRSIPVVANTRSVDESVDDRVRSILTGAGFDEALTYSFVSQELAGMLAPQSAELLSVSPSAGDFGSTLRQSLIPSLVMCRGENSRRGNGDAELFEIARVYLDADPNQASGQPRRIGIVSGRSFAQLRGVVDALARAIATTARVTVRPAELPGCLSGRSAEVLLNEEAWGWIGELDREAGSVRSFKLREAVTFAELNVAPLTKVFELAAQFTPLPAFPVVSRDINFVLDESVSWSELESTVRESAGPLLESVAFMEQYRGNHIPAGSKSYVLQVSYRAADRTLTGGEVDAAQHNVIEACQQRLQAVQR